MRLRAQVLRLSGRGESVGSIAAYALIGGLATTDLEGIKARFTDRTTVKAVSVFLAVVVVLFYLLWLSKIVPALLTFMSLLPLAIVAMIVSMRLYGQPVAVAPAAIFVVLSTVSLGMLVWYLRGLRERAEVIPRPGTTSSTRLRPWTYFALTLGWSWLLWLPVVLSGQTQLAFPGILLYALGGIEPGCRM